MARWIEGTVVAQKAWTERLFSLQVACEIGAFEPGQFARIALPVAGELVARPYSFVNAPRETPCEFYYNIVPEGPLSPRLAKLEPMDVVFLAPSPSGTFTLDEVPDAANLWLIATGTGLGPFLSMLKTEQPWKRFREIALVHAVRRAVELTYRETIAGFRARYPAQFRFVSFVSREPHAGSLRGRIPPAIEDERLERAAGLDLSARASQVMLCGNPDMVTDVVEALKARGMKRHRRREPGHIALEPYW
jgi:ferredoxin--NADP+ reductase